MKKKAFVLAVLSMLFLIPISASAAQDYYIKPVDAVITLEDDWICITKNTKPEDLDLAGTAFNYDGVKAALLQSIDMLNSPEYENVHFVAMNIDENVGLIEAQISSFENSETRSLWDISLVPDISDSFASSPGALEAYSNATDIWLGIENDTDYSSLSYLTFNNGRNVSVTVTTYDASSKNERLEAVHAILDKIQFTKKEPKAVSSSIEQPSEPEQTSGFQKWLSQMGNMIKHFIAFEVSSWIVFGGIAILLGIISFIISLFKRR